MKSTTLLLNCLLAVLVTTACPTLAQQPAPATTPKRPQFAEKTPQEWAQLQTAHLTQVLLLTAEQELQVSAISLNYAAQLQPLLAGGSRNLRTLHQAQQLQKRKDEELRRVLSATQYQQYQAMREEQKKQVKQLRAQR